MMTKPTVSFVRLDETNREEYLSLEVYDFQKGFIETPERSLHDCETHAWQIDWTIAGICAEGCMVGYIMHGMNRNRDVWLDRFMIDRRFQGKGYGKQALFEIIPLLRQLYPSYRRILLSIEPGNERAKALYEKAGFRMAGYEEDGESVMILCE